MILIEPISPIAFSVGPLAIRWYALAYVAAFIIGFWVLKKLANSKEQTASIAHCSLLFANSKRSFDDLFTALILGVILGGRLGYVLFYNLPFFLANPLEIFAVWHGGMSFHGGLLGVIVAVFLFASRTGKQQKQCEVLNVKCEIKKGENNSKLHTSHFTFRQQVKNAFGILDLLAVVTPIGLFFGRIANFVNMEVMGRETTRPWGVVFDGAGDIVPRHPSPLYEATLEGILLFIIMFSLWRWTKLRNKPGALSGIFAMLYATFRIFAEQFRQPDAQIGFLTSWGLTMGQLLSAAMFLAGAIIFAVAIKKK